jgi:hypothetical protein
LDKARSSGADHGEQDNSGQLLNQSDLFIDMVRELVLFGSLRWTSVALPPKAKRRGFRKQRVPKI